MRLTILAAAACALALGACTNPNPEETETAGAMPDTSVAESPAPDAADTGVAGEGAIPAQDGAETASDLPPVDTPEL